MKSFRDRNPYAVGIASVLLLGLLTGFAFAVGLFRLLEDTYTVHAEFDDAAGLKGGNEVRLAGVKVGRVAGIAVQHDHGTVIVTMEINRGVELGDTTTAEIALGTLLGAKLVRLEWDAAESGSLLEGSCGPGEEGERCHDGAPLIPRELAGDRVPFDVFELTRIATEGVQELDTEGLDDLVGDLADLTEGRRDSLTTLIESIDDVSRAVTTRDQQLDELLARAETLSSTLAEKDQTLVELIDRSQAILALLENRRAELATALGEGAEAVQGLAELIGFNRAQLDSLLTNLHPTLAVVEENLADAHRGLAWAGPAFYGQALAGSHGPWLDIYVRGVGPDIAQILCDVLAPGSVCS